MARVGRFRINKRNKINIGRVITKITITVISLWIGGEILTKVADAMNNSDSVFLKGFTLIGFQQYSDQSGYNGTEISTYTYCTKAELTDCLDGTISTTGILSVVGIVAMASLVMEFVNVRMA